MMKISAIHFFHILLFILIFFLQYVLLEWASTNTTQSADLCVQVRFSTPQMDSTVETVALNEL